MSLWRNSHLRALAASLAFTFLALHGAAAQYRLDPADASVPMLGPAKAKGAIVWSHGRSVTSEDSLSPTPSYMAVLRQAGWDTFRFNRLRDGDTLPDSARVLVDDVAMLKGQGYQKVVLAGQSFGAFLSLMAADASDNVHAVIATAPAAFGSFQDFYESWQANATRLYPLLETVRSARIMLFFFHGDDFDPGGRGERAKAILAEHNIDNLVVDQPPLLTGHWASTTGLFVRRFGECMRNFIEAESSASVACNSSWGESPSQQIAFPAQFHSTVTPVAVASQRPAPSGAFAGKWYGTYANGREVIFAIESIKVDEVTAIYAVGPGIHAGERSEWVRRTGRIVGDEIVFKDKGRPTLRYLLRGDGRLQASAVSPDGRTALETILRRTEWPGTPPIASASGSR
jgi:pimeloyl-ACP methyl ester carboxylesterase